MGLSFIGKPNSFKVSSMGLMMSMLVINTFLAPAEFPLASSMFAMITMESTNCRSSPPHCSVPHTLLASSSNLFFSSPLFCSAALTSACARETIIVRFSSFSSVASSTR